MKNKIVLITGGAGFIGSHLCDLCLELGAKVVVIDNFSTGCESNIVYHKNNHSFTLVEEDIRNYTKIENFFKNIDYVFHLGALADIVPSIEKPFEYHTTNVDGTFNVLNAALKFGVKKFVYAASSSCYGIPGHFPTDETAAISPQYPYALTKYLAESYVLHWGKVYKLPVVSLRLFNVYGPRARTSGTYGAVFGVFLKQKLEQKPFTIVGDGEQTRDFIFVTDVAHAFCMAATSKCQYEIFNVGSGKSYSINYLAGLIGGERINIPKRPGEPDSTHAEIGKIRMMLGWKPKVSFEQGVEIILKDIQCWSGAPLWSVDSIAVATQKWFRYLGN
ncbi:MAG: SDR family oxidoreductase [Oligoflexia bacterium]|nr:SDR family oxidoreductase [Oligoflexia bacterium]